MVHFGDILLHTCFCPLTYFRWYGNIPGDMMGKRASDIMGDIPGDIMDARASDMIGAIPGDMRVLLRRGLLCQREAERYTIVGVACWERRAGD